MKLGVKGWLNFGSNWAQLFAHSFLLFPTLLCHILWVWDAPEGSCAGGLQQQPQVAARGLCPSPASGEGRAWRREQPGPALRSQSRALPALAGAAPPASAHWLMVPLGINYAFRTRGYSNGKIVYLQLGELKAEAEERVAPPATAALLPPSLTAPQAQPGVDPAASTLVFPSWGDPWLPSPTQPLPAPFSQGSGCLLSAWPTGSSVAGRIQPISPSADFPP